eukprot:GHVT01085799.1.p1 GENE.GHVT01085799.1~~GHVT01085799.1.p1  ORF type:complete len:174 (-),score=18.36 GHVT01085799.1:1438-1959(-)
MMDGIRRRFKKFLCVTQRVSGEEVSVVKAASEVRTTPVVADRGKKENLGKKMTRRRPHGENETPHEQLHKSENAEEAKGQMVTKHERGVGGHSLNSDGLVPPDIHFRGSPNITATNDHECFAFPGLETLAAASEEDIRTFCMLTTKAQQPTAITNYNAIYADMVKYRSQSFVL